MCTPPCTDTHSLPCAAAGGDCCGMLVGWGPPGRNAKNLFNLIHLTEVIAGLDSGIFVFRMYCYFKNWLNRLNWRKLYCLSTFHCICELPPVSQLDCVQMRYPQTSFFEQQQMPVGNWTGRTCKLFALLKDIHESFRKIHSERLLLMRCSFQLQRQMQNWTLAICACETKVKVQLLWSSVRAEGRRSVRLPILRIAIVSYLLVIILDFAK